MLNLQSKELHFFCGADQGLNRFVFFYMDLNMMQEKANNRKYKYLEQFYADALTILHNIFICYGGKSTQPKCFLSFCSIFFFTKVSSKSLGLESSHSSILFININTKWDREYLLLNVIQNYSIELDNGVLPHLVRVMIRDCKYDVSLLSFDMLLY